MHGAAVCSAVYWMIRCFDRPHPLEFQLHYSLLPSTFVNGQSIETGLFDQWIILPEFCCGQRLHSFGKICRTGQAFYASAVLAACTAIVSSLSALKHAGIDQADFSLCKHVANEQRCLCNWFR